MYSPDGTNVYGARGVEIEVRCRVESCKIVLRGHFLFTCSDIFAAGYFD